jgi:hypothetical protein
MEGYKIIGYLTFFEISAGKKLQKRFFFPLIWPAAEGDLHYDHILVWDTKHGNCLMLTTKVGHGGSGDRWT